MIRKVVKIVLLMMVLNCTGCADKTLTSIMTKDDAFTIRRLIVLPFVNNSSEDNLGIVATRICETVCNQHSYPISNQADLRIYLQRKHLYVSQLTEQSKAAVFKELSEELQVNTLIKGKILTVSYDKIQGDSLPQVTLQLDLLNASNGSTIVRSFIDSSGEDYRTILRFGVVRTTTQLLQLMINNTIEDWQHKGVIR